MSEYNFSAIEKKWQKYWLENKTFRTTDGTDGRSGAPAPQPKDVRPKFYCLDMFPYPSGAGLHVGHPEGYTATDILCRYKRMKGFNVLHPMGWDAFGLPAEQYAVETGTHPAITTKKNVDRFREQIRALGFSYDWDREVNTTDPKYYRWTQWIFEQLYKKGLAYVAEVPVNWCPALGTVLANEEVIDGRSERGNHPVIRRPMRQWMLKITEYAERLLKDLDTLDWPEGIKEMQRNWIGKSTGALVDFGVEGVEGDVITVYTTRCDTLFGATYMVLSPEHALVAKWLEDGTLKNADEVKAYQKKAASKSDLERTELNKEKTGVRLDGVVGVNPVNGDKLPIFISDYVLASYGTGAIMAVPAHDERDFDFAKVFNLPIYQVVAPAGKANSEKSDGSANASPIQNVGALAKTSDKSELKISHDQVWANYEYFIKAVMPTAEKCGVRMALHPDDPCLPSLGGYARIFGSIEAYDRAYAIYPSPSNAVTFCQANFKLMLWNGEWGTGNLVGASVPLDRGHAGRVPLPDIARHFAKRIAFIHIRDVEGTKEDFTELFHDQGDTDQFALMRTYHELGLDVPVRGDHVPEMAYDRVLTPDGTPGYFTLGRLFANGYLKALLRGSE